MFCPVSLIALNQQKRPDPGVSAVDFTGQLAVWRCGAGHFERRGAGISHLYGFQLLYFSDEFIIAVSFSYIIHPQIICHRYRSRIAENPEISVNQDQGGAKGLRSCINQPVDTLYFIGGFHEIVQIIIFIPL